MAMSNILIVDDDSTFVNLLSEELTTYGRFEVLTATRKEEEISLLKKESVTIVIVDIDAGTIEGLEFLSLMSTAYPHIPCIVMTRNEHPGIKAINNCSAKDSVFCYMAKPSNLQEIGGAIVEGLHRLVVGDFVPGISVSKLLFLLKADQKTCRVQVQFDSPQKEFFDVNNGILEDALGGEKIGEDAAREIIGWPPVSFQLEPLPPQYRKQTIPSGILDTNIPPVLNTDTGSSSPDPTNDTAIMFSSEKKIKLFIVDDSRMMRKVVADVFVDDETVEVVGEAANGEEALQIMPQLNPDVVTLDVQMPVMDGLTTLKHMMIQTPAPTVMLSAYTREGAVVTFDALKYGAVDFVAKPSNVGGLDLKEQAREISKKVHLAAEVELGALKYIRTVRKDKDAAQSAAGDYDTVVAIGAAEGGYGTLLKILPHLSSALPAAYFVMLYATPEHVDSFVDYLSVYCPLTMQRAKNNGSVEGGVCYVSSAEEYLTLHKTDDGLVQHLSPAPFSSQRGSINMLMFSVAETMNKRSLGVILTGMGNDGVEGLAEIIRVGGGALVQNPKGCLYRAMPEAALKEFSEARVIADTKIAAAVQELVAGG